MKNNKIVKIIFTGICVTVLLIAGYWLWTTLDQKKTEETSVPAQDLSNTVLYQGKEYEYNSDHWIRRRQRKLRFRHRI